MLSSKRAEPVSIRYSLRPLSSMMCGERAPGTPPSCADPLTKNEYPHAVLRGTGNIVPGPRDSAHPGTDTSDREGNACYFYGRGEWFTTFVTRE